MAERLWSSALQEVAQQWRDPEHTSREEATGLLLTDDVRFTEESLAFSINHAAELIASGSLQEWVGEGRGRSDQRVVILNGGRSPVEALLDAAAASNICSEILVAVSGPVAQLVEAFFDEVNAVSGEDRVRLVAERTALEAAGVLIARGSSAELDYRSDRFADAEQGYQSLLLPDRTGIAVLTGEENHGELSGLAEDLLLHDGSTPQNVRIVLASEGQSPDPLLSALAGFREIFPPHPATDGSLAMTAAFLEALKVPLAVGPGFLLSKGEFDPQSGSHLRWVEYRSMEEIAPHLASLAASEVFLVGRESTVQTLRQTGVPDEIPILGFGDAHRPEPGQPPLTEELRSFLNSLRS